MADEVNEIINDVSDDAVSVVDLLFVKEGVKLEKVTISKTGTRVMVHSLDERLQKSKSLQIIHIIEPGKTTKFSGVYNQNHRTNRIQIFALSKFDEDYTETIQAEAS